jgi:hypothetical protein
LLSETAAHSSHSIFNPFTIAPSISLSLSLSLSLCVARALALFFPSLSHTQRDAAAVDRPSNQEFGWKSDGWGNKSSIFIEVLPMYALGNLWQHTGSCE